MNDITLSQLSSFSEIYRKILARIELLAEQRGLGWSPFDPIDFSEWEPANPKSSFQISWEKNCCGNWETESANILTADLLATTEELVEERRLRLIREEEARQAEARARAEREARFQRQRDLEILRQLKAKYPEEASE